MQPRFVVGKSRLEALSDGVYGVALTLLALDLRLPPLAEGLQPALLALWPKAMVWMLSFGVGVIFWLAQNHVLRQYERLDRPGLQIELAQLALITLLPFTTVLIGEHGNQVIASLIYSTHLALLALLSLLRVWRLQRKTELRAPDFDADDIRVSVQRSQLVFSCALLAVILAFVMPAWNMLALLGVMAPWPRSKTGTTKGRDTHRL